MIYQVHKQEGTHAGTRGMVTVFSFPETRSLKPGKQRVNTWGIIASDTGRQTETETPHFKVSGHGSVGIPRHRVLPGGAYVYKEDTEGQSSETSYKTR